MVFARRNSSRAAWDGFSCSRKSSTSTDTASMTDFIRRSAVSSCAATSRTSFSPSAMSRSRSTW